MKTLSKKRKMRKMRKKGRKDSLESLETSLNPQQKSRSLVVLNVAWLIKKFKTLNFSDKFTLEDEIQWQVLGA